MRQPPMTVVSAESVEPGPPVSFGIVGCGAIGAGIHLPVLTRMTRARVVAVADPSAEALRRAAAAGPVETFVDVEELLARDDIDAVVVCAPSDQHAELALAVVRARKHLYLEKPIATRLEDGERVDRAVERAGVTTAVGFNYRFHPDVQRLRDLLAGGAIGSVRHVATRLWEPAPPWRTATWRTHRNSGGGALLDLGSHHVDIVPWLLSDEIVAARATIRSRRTEHDVAAVHFRTGTGVVCESSFSYRSGRADELVLTGDEGRIRLDRYAGLAEILPLPRGRARRRVSPRTFAVARVRVLRPRLDPSYELALQAFVDRLRGQPGELPTIADGLRCLRVIAEAEGSAASTG